MGINLEVAIGRSLEERGVSRVEKVENAIKHSLTAMPAVTASGKLLSPVYVMLKEGNKEAAAGCFGPIAQRSIFKHPNIFVKAHISAIMNKSRTQEYFRDVLFPIAPNHFLLLCDFSTLFQDEETFNAANIKAIDFTKKTISPKTSGMIQPLDVFFKRQIKHFLKKFQDRVRLEFLNECQLSKRDNILKMILLAVHQFQAECFESMISFAFHKCGYILQRPPRFETSAKVCFPTVFENCQIFDDSGVQCKNLFFIKCASSFVAAENQVGGFSVAETVLLISSRKAQLRTYFGLPVHHTALSFRSFAEFARYHGTGITVMSSSALFMPATTTHLVHGNVHESIFGHKTRESMVGI
ncbi:hypothetical protein DMENIID0001_157350 [Sergentomyia squamirostris]